MIGQYMSFICYKLTRTSSLPITPCLPLPHPSWTSNLVLLEIPTLRWWMTFRPGLVIPYTVLASHQQMLELLSFLKVFPAWDKKIF